MKIFKYAVIVLVVLMVLICSTRKAECLYSLRGGEELVYSAKFLHIIPFGNIVMKVKGPVRHEGIKVYLLTCEASTAKWISLFFKAEATLNSYVNMVKVYPYKFEQILKVAGKPDDIRRATYHRAQNIMEAEGKGKKKVPFDVRDPISAIHNLRTYELKEGLEIKQTVNNNQSNYVFNSKVTGKKRVGRFDCWVLDSKIRRENKSMYRSMDVVFYISDDAERLPVLIKARTKVGPMTLRLLRHRVKG
ncbi:MAG: DUF3108 domain-containing protein [Candidatus Omnitrophica bacterium]|nr:DUF3108 domain-containing protein [Candidatus Omnitrophota bacterium]